MAKHPFKQEFGKRLKRIAEERGCYTAQSIANVAGATRAAVDTWLNGRAMPRWEQAARLTQAWHITLDWLFLGKPEGLPHATYIRLAALEQGQQPTVGAAPASVGAVAWEPPAKAGRRQAATVRAIGDDQP